MINRELKEKIFQLRRSGYSYNQITRETGIAKGTLSYIFSKGEISEEILAANKKRNLEESRKRILVMNAIRKGILQSKYQQIELEAEREFLNYKNEPIFIASLMLYLGEGDKSAKGSNVRICNTDSEVLKIFILFLKKYCQIRDEKIKFWMLGYKDLDSDACLEWWKRTLNLSENNLYKTQVIEGRHKSTRLLYGVGNITIASKSLKIRIIKWIRLMCEDLTRP